MIQNTPRNSSSLATAFIGVLVLGLAVSAIPTIAVAQTAQSGDVVQNPDIT